MPWAKCLRFMEKVSPCVVIPILRKLMPVCYPPANETLSVPPIAGSYFTDYSWDPNLFSDGSVQYGVLVRAAR